MSDQQSILIIGASSSIAEHCARQWLAQQAKKLVLVGRSVEKLQRVADDLKIRYPQVDIVVQQVDFLSTHSIQACIDQVYRDVVLDIALVAHGTLPDQRRCENNLDDAEQAIEINALSPVLFAQAILTKMLEVNHGHLAVIGSVAGDRGRKSNYIYGASKAFIDTYLHGMQHRLALMKSVVKVSLIKPGPTATPMTVNISAQGKLASVEQVAKEIVQGMAQAKSVIYAPKKWRLIMLIIRNLPFFLFKKLDI